VGEFPELQGVMGGYYARHDGLPEAVAVAIEDHYKPRFAGDALPRNRVALVVALADKLETLIGMFGIGNLPSGDKDPFALRRHALGVGRMLVEADLPLQILPLIDSGIEAFAPGLLSLPAEKIREELSQFLLDRLRGYFRDQGYAVQNIEAALAAGTLQHWADIPRRLAALKVFAGLAEAPALAAANKRIGNILKKAELAASEHNPSIDTKLLQEAAEQQLHAAMQTALPQADAQFAAGDYTASLQTLAALRAPVDSFFNDVMVNAEDVAVRNNRLALLHVLHQSMNRVADLSRLAA
jgi:glycyl-tRNA synthetase beta chain